MLAKEPRRTATNNTSYHHCYRLPAEPDIKNSIGEDITVVAGHGENKLGLSWKLPLQWLVFTVLKGAVLS